MTLDLLQLPESLRAERLQASSSPRDTSPKAQGMLLAPHTIIHTHTGITLLNSPNQQNYLYSRLRRDTAIERQDRDRPQREGSLFTHCCQPIREHQKEIAPVWCWKRSSWGEEADGGVPAERGQPLYLLGPSQRQRGGRGWWEREWVGPQPHQQTGEERRGAVETR